MNEFQREMYKKQVLKFTFDKIIDEDQATTIIKKSAKVFEISITDIDIYKKGKFVLGRN